MTTTIATLGYRAPAVCRLAGISYRQLDYWDKTEVVSPSVAIARGSGSQRLYSYADTLLLLTVRHLLAHGLGMATIRRVIETIRPLIEDGDYTALIFVTDAGHKVQVARYARDVVALMKQTSGAFIFSVGTLAAQLDDSLEELDLVS